MSEKKFYIVLEGEIPGIYQNSILSAYVPKKSLITPLGDAGIFEKNGKKSPVF